MQITLFCAHVRLMGSGSFENLTQDNWLWHWRMKPEDTRRHTPVVISGLKGHRGRVLSLDYAHVLGHYRFMMDAYTLAVLPG